MELEPTAQSILSSLLPPLAELLLVTAILQRLALAMMRLAPPTPSSLLPQLVELQLASAIKPRLALATLPLAPLIPSSLLPRSAEPLAVKYVIFRHSYVTGPCDVAETCPGNSASCPADSYNTGTTCRPTAGNTLSVEYSDDFQESVMLPRLAMELESTALLITSLLETSAED